MKCNKSAHDAPGELCYFDMKEVDYKSLELELVSLFLCRMKNLLF